MATPMIIMRLRLLNVASCLLGACVVAAAVPVSNPGALRVVGTSDFSTFPMAAPTVHVQTIAHHDASPSKPTLQRDQRHVAADPDPDPTANASNNSIAATDLLMPMQMQIHVPLVVTHAFAQLQSWLSDRLSPPSPSTAAAAPPPVEEDSPKFLAAQLRCQQQHGVTGVSRMLCTCTSLHVHDAARHLLCVSRVADRVIAVASTHHTRQDAHTALLLRRLARQCHRVTPGPNPNDASKAARCVAAAVQRAAGRGTLLHRRRSRELLHVPQSQE